MRFKKAAQIFLTGALIIGSLIAVNAEEPASEGFKAEVEAETTASALSSSPKIFVPGEEIKVKISAGQNSGITHLKLLIDYDENVLEPVENTATKLFSTSDVLSEKDSDGDGYFIFTSISSDRKDISVKTGVFAEITFKVKNVCTKASAVTVERFKNSDGYCVVYDSETDGLVSVPFESETEEFSVHSIKDNGVVKAPTCTEGGYTTYDCSACGEKIIGNVTEKLGHDLKHTDAKAATCTESGYAAYDTCQREGCGYTTYEEIPATGHKKGEAVTENRIEPTCTKDGSYDSVVYCDVCKAELSRETKTIPALGHKKGEAVTENRTEPTCTKDGSYDSVVYCDVCKAELSRETKTIPATGHKKGEAVTENRTEPTCTKDGSYDSVVYCDVCKAELSRETKIIPALGHTYGEATVTAPEYGKEGYSEHECTVCGYKEKFDFTEALKYPMGQTLVFEDGIWKYVSDGRLAPEYTGLVEYYGTWYYVENGILNWGYTGLTNYYGTWYYVEGGILNWGYSGLTNFYGTWYYVEGGILNWGYTGLTNFYGTWYYVDDGILNWGYTGLTNFYGTWYYVEGGILNWGYTGLTNFYGTWYYVANGVLDWNYTGSTYYYGTLYYVQNGVLVI